MAVRQRPVFVRNKDGFGAFTFYCGFFQFENGKLNVGVTVTDIETGKFYSENKYVPDIEAAVDVMIETKQHLADFLPEIYYDCEYRTWEEIEKNVLKWWSAAK